MREFLQLLDVCTSIKKKKRTCANRETETFEETRWWPCSLSPSCHTTPKAPVLNALVSCSFSFSTVTHPWGKAGIVIEHWSLVAKIHQLTIFSNDVAVLPFQRLLSNIWEQLLGDYKLRSRWIKNLSHLSKIDCSQSPLMVTFLTGAAISHSGQNVGILKSQGSQ